MQAGSVGGASTEEKTGFVFMKQFHLWTLNHTSSKAVQGHLNPVLLHADTKPSVLPSVLFCIAKQTGFTLRTSLLCTKDCLLSGNTLILKDSCPIRLCTGTVSYRLIDRAVLQLWIKGFSNGLKHIRIAQQSPLH